MFYPVITSKVAQKDFEKIKSTHANILEGMANQSMKVSAYTQQKATEMAAQNSMNMEMEKAKMVADTAAQKNAMDFSIKQSEVDIKRAALAQI